MWTARAPARPAWAWGVLLVLAGVTAWAFSARAPSAVAPRSSET